MTSVCADLARPMTTAEVRAVVAAAGRAPSVHNSQPWLFEWDGRHLDLRADWSRRLPVLDPSGRQLLVSCGAALALACVALRAAGRDPAPRLGVDLRATSPLATLDTGRPLAAAGVERARELRGAIEPRRMARGPFTERAVPPALAYSLAGAAAAEGAIATLIHDPAVRARVTALVTGTDAIQRSSAQHRGELHTWLRDPGDNRDDGVSREFAGATTTDPPNRFGHSTWWPAAREHHDQRPTAARAPAERVTTAESPEFIVLSTTGDEPSDWLVAGRALAMLLLVATRSGLGAMLVNQPVDSDASRRELADIVGVADTPQALLVIGYPYGRPSPPSHRRTIDSYFTSCKAGGPLTAGGVSGSSEIA